MVALFAPDNQAVPKKNPQALSCMLPGVVESFCQGIYTFEHFLAIDCVVIDLRVQQEGAAFQLQPGGKHKFMYEDSCLWHYRSFLSPALEKSSIA